LHKVFNGEPIIAYFEEGATRIADPEADHYINGTLDSVTRKDGLVVIRINLLACWDGIPRALVQAPQGKAGMQSWRGKADKFSEGHNRSDKALIDHEEPHGSKRQRCENGCGTVS
jgi:hypothetical protein